jgi:predicted nucleic acid-binding protein
MKAFADTSFLYALYRQQENSRLADLLVSRMRQPICVSSLVLFEFRQSARFQVFRFCKDRALGFSKREAHQMLNVLQENIAAGGIELIPTDWQEVHSIAERLSSQFTISRGHHALDILHVATALQHKADQLLTFDSNQGALAKAAGLDSLDLAKRPRFAPGLLICPAWTGKNRHRQHRRKQS